jgi:lysophospholipase L1-like esterase
MVRTLLILALVLLPLAANSEDSREQCHILMAGDSTMQNVDPAKNPDFGWGQVLPRFAKESTEIVNLAKGGRSTKSFIAENRWSELVEQVRAGSWVFIQFGHNDASYKHPERYTAPVDYEANLRNMVSDVRAKSGNPVLITPVVRRYFDSEGKLRDMHGIYPSLVHRVANKTRTPVIDLFERSSHELVNAGVLKTIDWFVHIGPGVHPCCPEGRMDNTHFTEDGAEHVAQWVISELKTTSLPLKDCFL